MNYTLVLRGNTRYHSVFCACSVSASSVLYCIFLRSFPCHRPPRRVGLQGSCSVTMKYLVSIDFDHTILDDNSDTAILVLAGQNEIPQEIKNIQFTEGWTAFMQGVFTYLHENGISEDQIKDLVKELPPVDGMIDLVTELKKRKLYDMIIISDSNSIFIKVWLEKHDLENCFLKVFTNPAEIIRGIFRISPYHIQDHCKLSTRNMCKGQILDEFINEKRKNGVIYDKVIYIGDGVNDFCPILHLRERDLACVRNNYKLFDLVEKAKKGKSLDNSGKPHVISAEVLTWETGHDIMKHLHIKE